ncbi:MAG: hypothetical protein ACI8VC_002939 [Candidatus Endobugula sp.]|jgi:hypothetical protein
MKKKHFIGKPLIGWPEKVDHYTIDFTYRYKQLSRAWQLELAKITYDWHKHQNDSSVEYLVVRYFTWIMA